MEIVDAIYRPNPTNVRNTIKMYLNETEELAQHGWELGSEVLSEGDRLTDLARQPLIGSVHFRTLSALLFVVRGEGVEDGGTMEPLCCTSIRLLHLSVFH